MQKRIVILLISLVALFGLSWTAIAQGVIQVGLREGESAEINCDGQRLVGERQSKTRITVHCRRYEATPTPNPQPTDPPPPDQQPGQPFPDAPACADHDDTAWHSLWNEQDGCHYDHEHGAFDPNDPTWVELFGVSPLAYTGQAVSYPWQTPDENQLKHEGYTWDFGDFSNEPDACNGRENDPNGAPVFLTEHHWLAQEPGFTHRVHSIFAMVIICPEGGTVADGGVAVFGGHMDFGQLTDHYQGSLLDRPGIQQPQPAYDTAREPYGGNFCFNENAIGTCQRTLETTRSVGSANTTWNSEDVNVDGNSLIQVLWRGRDAHQAFNEDDHTDVRWICSADGGATYDPVACRFTNSTDTVHQVMGHIPPAWDGLDGQKDGRVTYQGFTNLWGELDQDCTEAGPACAPLYLDNVPVGSFGTFDGLVKTMDPSPNLHSPSRLPNRNIFFCDGEPCAESDAGATPSGWIGSKN